MQLQNNENILAQIQNECENKTKVLKLKAHLNISIKIN